MHGWIADAGLAGLIAAIALRRCGSGGRLDEAITAWEARACLLTDHTQASAADLASTRELVNGMPGDSECFRAARHVPAQTAIEAHL